jgi:hypothetical protein
MGTFFSWGLMLHARMIGKIHRCQTTDSGDFVFGSILVAWFLERVPMLRPRVLFLATRAAGATTDAVGSYFGIL